VSIVCPYEFELAVDDEPVTRTEMSQLKKKLR